MPANSGLPFKQRRSIYETVLQVKKSGYSGTLSKPKRPPKDRPKGVNSAAVQAVLKKQEDERKKRGKPTEYISMHVP